MEVRPGLEMSALAYLRAVDSAASLARARGAPTTSVNPAWLSKLSRLACAFASKAALDQAIAAADDELKNRATGGATIPR
jgi:hypothetical protein